MGRHRSRQGQARLRKISTPPSGRCDARSRIFSAEVFARQLPDTEVARAARYATLGGGHRWRAFVAVAAGKIFRDDALPLVLPAACGVELAHAASLLCSMTCRAWTMLAVRRGKPCTHRDFPAWAADMAPVFMVTLAYQISLDKPVVSRERPGQGGS